MAMIYWILHAILFNISIQNIILYYIILYYIILYYIILYYIILYYVMICICIFTRIYEKHSKNVSQYIIIKTDF